MIIQQHLMQPGGGYYSELFDRALSECDFDHLDVSVAYATMSGASLLLKHVLSEVSDETVSAWGKRWLVGIDWCRSYPPALEMLNGLPNSALRVPDGEYLVENDMCVPRRTFHPKAYMLSSSDAIAVISGSGNLSCNGLSRGCEVASLTLVENPTSSEQEIWDSCRNLVEEFESIWANADPWDAVRDRYEVQYQSAPSHSHPTPTDDDTQDVRESRPLDSRKLRQLRACEHLWIETRQLSKNRGPDLPGNQLMLSPMTRVFFGFPANDEPTDTMIGHIRIRYAGEMTPDRSLRFSNNSMDVLTLPVPGSGGPDHYDHQTLMFEQQGDGDGTFFELIIGDDQDRAAWKEKSHEIEADFSMSGSGREWGVF